MRFALLNGEVYQVDTWAGYYALQEQLRRLGIDEIQVYSGTTERPISIGVYVPAYIK